MLLNEKLKFSEHHNVLTYPGRLIEVQENLFHLLMLISGPTAERGGQAAPDPHTPRIRFAVRSFRSGHG